jgi:hypothetical protein
MEKNTIKYIAAGVVIFGVGFAGGMEYKAYQIRSVMEDAFTGVFEGFTDGMEESESVSEKEANIPAEAPMPTNTLSDKVTFAVTEKRFIEGDWDDYNAFTFQFTNNTDKEILGVKGVITFNDIFGDQIKRVSVSYDEGIAVGESKPYKATISYNQFMDEDILLRQTDMEKLKYEWEVTAIVYADGTEESY